MLDLCSWLSSEKQGMYLVKIVHGILLHLYICQQRKQAYIFFNAFCMLMCSSIWPHKPVAQKVTKLKFFTFKSKVQNPICLHLWLLLSLGMWKSLFIWNILFCKLKNGIAISLHCFFLWEIVSLYFQRSWSKPTLQRCLRSQNRLLEMSLWL